MNPATQSDRRPGKQWVCLCLLVALILQAAPEFIRKSGAQSANGKQPQPIYRAAIPNKEPQQPGIPEGLAKGKFLVASRRLQDPNFSQTVVLLVDYGAGGAMGVVINRPSTVRLATVFPDIEQLKQRKDTVYVGGPVTPNLMLMLVRSADMPEESQEIIRDVYISSSWKLLERLIKSAPEEKTFRLFAGYAGWAPNQLDYERSRGDWYVLKADAETVFTKNPSELWPELIRRVTAKWVRNENSHQSLMQKGGPGNETFGYRRYARNRPPPDRAGH